MTSQILLFIAIWFPWTLTAAAIGMYLGERGRRMDAQRREGVIAVDPPAPPKVTPPESATPATMAAALDEGRARYIAECVREGFSEDEAAADWERMLAQASVDEAAGWQGG